MVCALLVHSFSLQGVDTAGLAVRPFRRAMHVSVVAVTDGHSAMSQPVEVLASVMAELMNETAIM